MSGQFVRLKVSIECSKAEAYRILNAVAYATDLRSGAKSAVSRKFLLHFNDDLSEAEAAFSQLIADGLGVDAMYEERTNALLICDSFEGARPQALARLLQIMLPKKLPISFTYTVDGQEEAVEVEVTRSGITETEINPTL